LKFVAVQAAFTVTPGTTAPVVSVIVPVIVPVVVCANDVADTENAKMTASAMTQLSRWTM
jgi:ABC-type transport system involved in cytochrome c biogenesis permease component